MKPIHTLMPITLALAMNLFATPAAHAYYNPSTGRWLSRDPADEGVYRDFAGRTARSRQPRPSFHTPVYVFAQNDGVDALDLVGLKTIHFRVAGDSSGAYWDVLVFDGLEDQIEDLKKVLALCNCPTINVDVRWGPDNLGGPTDAQWDLTSALRSPDDKLLRGMWRSIRGGKDVPLVVTGFPIQGDGAPRLAFGLENEGILLLWDGFWFEPRTLAHELGHYAGYHGGDLDHRMHSSKQDNIMYRYSPPGATPDKTYCKKVAALAH